MILVVMYGVITRGNFENPLFAYMYIGNAFYMYVGRMLNGMAWAIIDDREHYKTLKYVYTAPIHFPTYLVGRSVASFLVATISVAVTLLAGVLFFKLPINLLQVNWPMFIAALLVGISLLAMMGLVLAGILLLLAHHMWGIGEAVAGSLYLFSGAIFPLDVLPPALRWLGYIMPVTYWLELMRRSLVSSIASTYPTFSGLSDLASCILIA
jgi:ABC-2 type transport system permease protein